MCHFRTMAQALKSWQELGARVAEARKVAQLSQAELATAVNLDRTAITKLESGERKLDSLELVRIAGVLKRSIDWFLSPPLPAVVSRRKRRDTTDESRADAVLEGLAHDVKLVTELGLLAPPSTPRLVAVDSVETAEVAARTLRQHLGLSPGPVWDLLAVAERLGCYAFCIDLRDESLDGSYLRLDAGGVAVVNGAKPSGRRRFTLAHELGHHVFSDDFSDEWIVGADSEGRERLINAFVIHFLMPREACAARWLELDGRREPRPAALALGAEFGVSWTAVLGHLRNLDLIDPHLHDRLRSDAPSKADYLEGGVTIREELAAPAVPPRYAQAVMRAFKRHKLGRGRTLDLLHGAASAQDLPPEDHVPLESLRAQFELD
jgi:Zn-dependent peptidase ImmA (M78 family)/transcriptional regulator with XRE-family HTH domain